MFLSKISDNYPEIVYNLVGVFLYKNQYFESFVEELFFVVLFLLCFCSESNTFLLMNVIFS